MKIKAFILFFLAALFITSCVRRNGVEGLWVVKKVVVGEQEMTPNARWMRFNADSTQQSGNGWFQHSFGTWSLNEKTGELQVENVNGLNDPYGPFRITVENNTMHWSRNEEGQLVEIYLEQADTLPATYGDELLGLWGLKNASGNGPYFTDSLNATDNNSFIFFRWDRIFVIGSEKGRYNGVYNVNGHRPELELIPYDEELSRNFWKIEFNSDRISLTLLNSDSNVVREFVRIHEFPE